MNKSKKAALLSAFLLPGAGHIFLKKYIAGVILASTSFSALYFLISTMVESALQITEKIQAGDVTAITELVTKQSTGAEAQQLNIATSVLIISWLIGIVDAYRVGRRQDKEVVKKREDGGIIF